MIASQLPEEQFRLLRKVFAYVDTDEDGVISPAELRAIVERFGLKMVASQLEAYIEEFDADGAPPPLEARSVCGYCLSLRAPCPPIGNCARSRMASPSLCV